MVSVARYAYDGVEVLDGKIYFAGGYNNSAQNLLEEYDPSTDSWQTLAPMSQARSALAAAVLHGKYYAIGGSTGGVEIYDPSTDQWSTGTAPPMAVDHGTAITINGKILLVGGRSSGQFIDKVFEYDPITDLWSEKSSMSIARSGVSLLILNGKIWAIGGKVVGASTDMVEIYDPLADQTAAPTCRIKVDMPAVWVANGVYTLAVDMRVKGFRLLAPLRNLINLVSNG